MPIDTLEPTNTKLAHGMARVMLRKRLQQMASTLRAEIGHDADILAIARDDRGEDTTTSQHPADVASDLEMRELLLIDEQRRIRVLRDVDAALERMDRGTYGRCVDCGRPIPDARLEVLPQSARDAACARAAEAA